MSAAAACRSPMLPEGSPLEELFDDLNPNQGQGDEAMREARSLGSGFIISADGLVVTNNHVIEGADEILVFLTDGTRLPAKLVGADDKTDLAVLKVEAGRDLPFVEFGDSDSADVGDWVMAIGNPFGLGGSVTLGHRLGAQPRHPVRALRPVHPDRRGDQPGQFRRAAVRHGRQGRRHQHRDHRARRLVAGHRLCGAGQPRASR